MTKETKTSPIGNIIFMNVDRALPNRYKSKTNPYVNSETTIPKMEYSIRLMFDGNTEEGKEFRTWVEGINPNKVVTNNPKLQIPEGHYVVRATSQFEPTVFDAEGCEVDEKPIFGRGATGKASMKVAAAPGSNGMGGTLYLQAVGIVELEEGETSSGVDYDDLLGKIKEAKKS